MTHYTNIQKLFTSVALFVVAIGLFTVPFFCTRWLGLN